MRRIVLAVIHLYQKTISPDHGVMRHAFRNGYCRYHPTCSQYGYEAIERYGIWRGGLRLLYRILRCNPWSRGGHDPVM